MRAATHRIPAEDQRDVVGRAETHNSPLNQIFTNKGLKLSRINPASTEVKPCVSP